VPNKQQVIDAHRLHPDWTSKQIAIAIVGVDATEKHLDTVNGWVRAVAHREGLTLGAHVREARPKSPKPPKPPKPESLMMLGQAARALGFSVTELFALRQANPRPPAPTADASIEDIGEQLRALHNGMEAAGFKREPAPYRR
jgi:hypothetical protein